MERLEKRVLSQFTPDLSSTMDKLDQVLVHSGIDTPRHHIFKPLVFFDLAKKLWRAEYRAPGMEKIPAGFLVYGLGKTPDEAVLHYDMCWEDVTAADVLKDEKII